MKTSFTQLLARLPGPVSVQWPAGAQFVQGMTHGTMSVELYAPRDTDPQTPHRQDELYFIIRGHGDFVLGDERHAFNAGDAFFVAAGVVHRFENFSEDFATWVVFWGPD